MEVQFRTIAMDFWASLEHKMRYKKNIPENHVKYLQDELYDCARQSAELDNRMQNIRNLIAEEAEEKTTALCNAADAMTDLKQGGCKNETVYGCR